MLTRLWTTEFDRTRESELKRFADEVSRPMFESMPGFRGHVYAASGTMWLTQTFWDSAADIDACEASTVYQSVVDQLMETGIVIGQQTTEVYSVNGWSLPGG